MCVTNEEEAESRPDRELIVCIKSAARLRGKRGLARKIDISYNIVYIQRLLSDVGLYLS